MSEFMGTPAYMAPEQVRGDPVTPAADIYALGVVLYEMVIGAWPFTGDNPLAIAAKRLEGPPTPPRKHVPDLDPMWESTILRCLRRDPKDRFENAVELALSLGGEGVGAAPKRATSRWLAWGAIAAIAVATAAVILTFFGPERTQIIRQVVRPETQVKIDDPAGAELFIDGADRGKVPLRARVTAGRHIYRVEAPPAKPVVDAFTILDGETLDVVLSSAGMFPLVPGAAPGATGRKAPAVVSVVRPGEVLSKPGWVIPVPAGWGR